MIGVPASVEGSGAGRWIAVAWLSVVTAASLDLLSRAATISAVPALIALQLQLVALSVLLVAGVLMLRHGPHRGDLTRWTIATIATSGLILLRWRIDPIAPTTAPVVPLLAIAPTALTADLVVRWRRTRPLASTGVEGLLSALISVAAVCCVAIGLTPGGLGNVFVGGIELQVLGMVVLASGLGAATCTRRGRRARVRFGAAAALGMITATSGTSGADDPLGLVVAANIAVIALLAAPRIARIARAPMARLRAAVRALARRFRAAGVEIYHLAVGSAIRAIRSESQRSTAAPRRTAAPRVLSKGDRAAAVVMFGISFVVVVFGAVWAHGVGWQPTAHAATIMARAHDVGTANHPWTGMVTSLGSSLDATHPGPMAIDLLAPFVRILGVQNGALLAGSMMTLCCWIVATWAAWRAAGRMAALAGWTMGAVVIEVAALGATWEANNISLTILAMFTVFVTSWAATTGTWRAWWWVVGLGSLCAQSYLTTALIVLGPIVWSGVVLRAVARRSPVDADRRAARSALRIGMAILAVAWAQPLIDAVIHAGGNLRDLFVQATHPSTTVGAFGLVESLAWIFSLPPRWRDVTSSFAIGGSADDFIGGSVLLGLAVAGIVMTAWWRTRRTAPPVERDLRVLTLLVVVGAMVNATQLPAEHLRSFQLGWLVVASLCVWFTILLSIAFAVARGAAHRRPPLTIDWLRTGAVAAAALMVIGTISTGPDRIEAMKGAEFTIDAMVTPLVDQTASRIPMERTTLVLALDSRLNQGNTDTILSNLIVRGLDAKVEPDVGIHYGRRRFATEGWTGPMLLVTNALDTVKPDATKVASARVPGWSDSRYRSAVEEISAIVKEAGTVELEPWVKPDLTRYLAGWVEHDVCGLADRLRRGTASATDLPPGLVLTLYADNAVRSPRLPTRLLDEAATLTGQSPLEVWYVESDRSGSVSASRLLRDGSQCPPVRRAG